MFFFPVREFEVEENERVGMVSLRLGMVTMILSYNPKYAICGIRKVA
jgi:hypothetical protein